MKALVLAEKPNAARDFARVLGCKQKHKSHFEGPRHVVTWALGHLVELAEPEDYNKKYSTWRLEDLPLLPRPVKLKVIPQTRHQFRAIADLARRKDIGELIIATDAGREGELVARWIMKLVGWQKPFRRLWISSQTDQAIRAGFANLRPGHAYDNLYQSAACRAEADWLIGINVTRALTCKYNAQLSAGRVQTPTLATIVDREKEIRAFTPQDYWTVEADFGLFRGQWQDKGSSTRLFCPDAAQAICQRVVGKTGSIVSLMTQEKREPHPLAYDLTELQRDANRRLGFSAKKTSTVLQRLYEHHKLVTYPRTDSRYLSSDIVATLKDRLAAIAVGQYAALVRPLMAQPLRPGKRVVNDSLVTDHHAIIPTGERLKPESLTSDESRIFDLIARRFIALFYPACQIAHTTVVAEVAGHRFTASGQVVKELGWRRVHGHDQENPILPPDLEQGRPVRVKTCRAVARQTQPPARYTEATLLTMMENHNLGTPATRADIIEKLLQTEAIANKGGQLIPTSKGEQLVELAAAELRSPELTARWERELEGIARGKGDPTAFVAAIRHQAQTLVRQVAESDQEYRHHNLTRSRCPHCGQFLLEKNTRQGRTLICPDRTCRYRLKDEKRLSNRRCPQCHKKMEIRQGKAGTFFHCRPCNVVETPSTGNKREDKRLVQKYSDKNSLSASLGEALKAALDRDKG